MKIIAGKINNCWYIDIFRFVVKVKEWNTFPDRRRRRMTKSGVNQRPLAGDAQQRAPNPPNPRAPNQGRNRAKRKRRNKNVIVFNPVGVIILDIHYNFKLTSVD